MQGCAWIVVPIVARDCRLPSVLTALEEISSSCRDHQCRNNNYVSGIQFELKSMFHQRRSTLFRSCARVVC